MNKETIYKYIMAIGIVLLAFEISMIKLPKYSKYTFWIGLLSFILIFGGYIGLISLESKFKRGKNENKTIPSFTINPFY